ncbi:MAG: hypothetical protein E7564_10080 [Ruminococcaceae bacterium]|nr:hypothetical protein [Oscillospiraceae bacterium]
MKTFIPSFKVGFTSDKNIIPEKFIDAKVPGAIQLDFQRAENLPDYRFGVNFKDYKWMEDVFAVYESKLNISLKENEKAELIFKGIDYKYEISIDGKLLLSGEGMFREIKLDITEFCSKEAILKVLLYPIPKDDISDTRTQVKRSCKSAAAYTWDWHPRLVSTGIWDECFINVYENAYIKDFEVSYRLNESLDNCFITSLINLSEKSKIKLSLIYENEIICEKLSEANTEHKIELNAANPKLWYPHNIGEQNLYKLKAEVLNPNGEVINTKERSIGFKRSKLLMNEYAWIEPSSFPKSRSDAPITLEINGLKVFAKGSNLVNVEIFPSEMNEDKYEKLIKLAKDANMNIFRIWGGGFINKESFFDICDREGMMIWEEFPLACNEYPDDDDYLKVLEREATAIVKRLRTHPAVVLWCGGNELFNNWSKMTDQHHALRLLDSICYKEDRFTPFIMTSPLNGMAHGHYLNYDEKSGREFITDLCDSYNTAYTEFGSPSGAEVNFIKSYISENDYKDLNCNNEVWREHHAFGAWEEASWLRIPEAEYYFGGFESTEDLMEKTLFIQKMCYKSLFEEMRKQWPHCSMALNWCFNEPWPCFANNSLISYPDIAKPAYYAVKDALRPTLASLRVRKHLYNGGEEVSAEIWLLNDSFKEIKPTEIKAYYSFEGSKFTYLGSFVSPLLKTQTNAKCGTVSFMIPENYNGKIYIELKTDNPDFDSSYVYLARSAKSKNNKTMLNI